MPDRDRERCLLLSRFHAALAFILLHLAALLRGQHTIRLSVRRFSDLLDSGFLVVAQIERLQALTSLHALTAIGLQFRPLFRGEHPFNLLEFSIELV